MQQSLKTERLILRDWREEDLAPFRALNGDSRVMEYFPRLLSAQESDALAEKIRINLAKNGFGLYAAEIAASGRFIGFIGLSAPSFESHFTPCIEVGWRLAYDYWGRGYAPEAARAVMSDGFSRLGLKEIVSFTAATNTKSIRVMEKLAMKRNPQEDFAHPALAEDSPLSLHVLYRKEAD